MGGKKLNRISSVIGNVMPFLSCYIGVGPNAVVSLDLIGAYFDFATGARIFGESDKNLIFYCSSKAVFLRGAYYCVHDIELDLEVVVSEKVGAEKGIYGGLVVANPAGR